MALSTEALTVQLEDRAVLRAVSLRLAAGRVTAVLGANGAGKSTLLRALAGLVPAAAGRVLLDTRDVAGLLPRERAQAIGYLPQDAVVHWNMAVRDVVALGRLPHGGGTGQIANALTATGTAALATRAIRSLSGGERARVLLARVLAGEPRWLLADEPLASLDLRHQLETVALLRAVAARGVGVVTVLHDLGLALRLADEVVLLAEGAVLAHGAARETLTADAIAAAYGVRTTIVAHADGVAIIPVTPT